MQFYRSWDTQGRSNILYCIVLYFVAGRVVIRKLGKWTWRGIKGKE